MQNRTKTEEFLRAIKLPEETKTYAVIGHGYIIDKVREMLALKGFVVKEELYKGENKGQEAMAFMQLENTKDPDMGMTFNWTNSYNKKLKFSCAIGGFIYDSKVPFVSSDSKSRYNRLHKGTALSETTEVIEQMIEQAEEHFDKIIEMKQKFASIEVSRKDYAKLMGLLYFDKQAISSEQINIVKREYDKPSFKCNHPGTLWSLYKTIMFAIVDQSPNQWYQQQIKINNYVQILYNIAHEDNRDGDNFVAEDEPEMQASLTMTDEQIEMIESEYAYPLETVGVKEFPLEDGQYGKPFDEENPLVEGEVTLDIIPVEEKSEELQEIDEVLAEKEQPAVSFFDSIDKKAPLESQSLMIVDFSDDPEPTVVINEEGVFEETATCDNCGSAEVIFNASAQMICDNCGHEEDTGLGANDEEFIEEEPEQVFEEEDDELNDMFLNEDTSDSFVEVDEIVLPTAKPIEDEFSMEEEPITIHIESDQEYANRVAEIEGEPEEEEVPWQTTETPEQMNALRNAMIADEEAQVMPEPAKQTKIEDLFDLEEEFDFDEEPEPVVIPVAKTVKNPKIGEFIERFYKGDPNQGNLQITETEQYTIVELDSHETFVL